MRTAIFSILLAVLAVLLLGGAGGDGTTAATPETNYAFQLPEKTPAAESAPANDSAAICVWLEGERTSMSLRDYLIGTLAAEMPADYRPEALKAQAVAARTYALYKASRGCPAAHPEAPVCGEAGCCAAYRSPTALLEKWGPDFYEKLRRIEEAVDETAGLCLTFEDGPILAVFHASSAGATESCAAVWGTALPYLTSVTSPESGADVESSVLISWSDLLETVGTAYPEASFGEERADWLTVTEWTESGRVAALNIGGVPISGMEFRFLFDLRSTDFQVTPTEEGLRVVVRGYGHGVGLSQQGAELMAENGADFSDILGHYYPGCALVPLAISDILG